MARARKRQAGARSAAPRPRPARAPRPTAAETRLLGLARELTGLPLDAALERLVAAWAPGATLPRDAARAFIESRGDKTAALALAWAREQVRLALEEILAAASRPERARAAPDPETRAWLLLAACESVSLEPPAAAADRLRAILELAGHGARSG